ncbi:alpha/beta hydrolase [Corynebacterium kutscheri]|uniref:alpha/beta hydrolase n=1 Tax=Corynebacterium kutscheri TaxID=35755 RepID=UPI0037BE5DC9
MPCFLPGFRSRRIIAVLSSCVLITSLSPVGQAHVQAQTLAAPPAAPGSIVPGSTASDASLLGSVNPGSLSSDISALIRDGAEQAVGAASNLPVLELDSLQANLDLLYRLNADHLLPKNLFGTRDLDFPLPTDPSIKQVSIVAKEDEPQYQRMQRWSIASPSMQRNVSVQVMLPPDPSKPAPILYMLDGMSAPKISGWIRLGRIQEYFADKNVIVVMPTQAGGSLYTNWQNVDPVQGVAQWETFLGQELPQVMESSAAGLHTNGKRAIGGLSMGAGGAVRTSALNPGVFDATFGLSGCYTTLDSMSRKFTEIAVEWTGAELDNVWGPYGSPEWHRHDLSVDPSGLKKTKLYLFNATGSVRPLDLERFADSRELYEIPGMVVMERATLNSTRRLEASLKQHGITDNVTVVYQDGGIHDWPMFADALPGAWENVRSALY